MAKRRWTPKLVGQNGEIYVPRNRKSLPLGKIQEKLKLWWDGGEYLPEHVVSDELAEAFRTMLASIRRGWIWIGIQAIVFLVIGNLIYADRYWVVFLFITTVPWLLFPRFEEPSVFLWHAAILGWLAVVNILIPQIAGEPIWLRVLWTAIGLWQAYSVYISIRTYREYKSFYTLKDPRTRKHIVSRELSRGYIIGLTLTAVAISFLFASLYIKQATGLLLLLAYYTGIIATAFAIANLGVPDIKRRRAILGTTIILTVIVVLLEITAVLRLLDTPG